MFRSASARRLLNLRCFSSGLTEDQREFQKLAAQFAAQQMAPFAQKWDEDKYLPVDVLRKAAELGFAAVYADPEFGGTGLSRKDAVVIFEQLAQGRNLFVKWILKLLFISLSFYDCIVDHS